jgi:hypothetical protein
MQRRHRVSQCDWDELAEETTRGLGQQMTNRPEMCQEI